MEKMFDVDEHNPLSSSLYEKPVVEAVQVPFDPLTLRRPLRLFRAALGLHPGVTDRPDPDFLVYVFEGAGHKQLLRSAAGAQFKNLEHFLRGEHTPTETTWRLLQSTLGIDEDTLRLLAPGRRSGPLSPAFISLFQALEGIFVRSFRFVTFGTVKCPCCGGDVLDDARRWWGAQPIQLGEDAYIFVDRLLKAMLGAVQLLGVVARFGPPSAHLDSRLLHQLASPECHPVGQWMKLLKLYRGLKHEWQLTVASGSRLSAGPVPDGRLRKWRSGQELLPFDRAREMMAGARDEQVLKHALLAARTLTLAIDVVQATAEMSTRPSRRVAQEVISARLRQLDLHLQMGRVGLARKLNELLASMPARRSDG